MSLSTLRHNALVYESHGRVPRPRCPFLEPALEAGEGAIVAHTKPGLAMMREALGPEAAQVTFVDVSCGLHAAGANPRRLPQGLRRTAAEDADAARGRRRPVRPRSREWDLWTGYEAVFNRSFGHLPAWVLCSYNANGTPDPIIEGVWQTHPEVVADDSLDAQRPLRGPRPPPAPHHAGAGDSQACARSRSAAAPRSSESTSHASWSPPGTSDAQTLDLLLAATEIATTRCNTAAASRSPRRTRPGTIRLRDRRPRPRLRRPRQPATSRRARDRRGPLGRPAADLADRVLWMTDSRRESGSSRNGREDAGAIPARDGRAPSNPPTFSSARRWCAALYVLVWYTASMASCATSGSATASPGGAEPGMSLTAVAVGGLVIVPPYVSYVRFVGRPQRAERLVTRPRLRGAAAVLVPLLVALVVGTARVVRHRLRRAARHARGHGLAAALAMALAQRRLNAVWTVAGPFMAGWPEPQAAGMSIRSKDGWRSRQDHL